MNDLQEDEMNHAEEATMHPDNDFFVVRQRIAEDLARARAENLTHAGDGAANRAGRSGRTAAAWAWLGRRLVTVGTILAGDPEPC
jgi:hypothetical protein